MVRLNPEAITAAALGAVTLYASTGRKIPEPLLVFSIMSATVSFIGAISKSVVVEEKTIEEFTVSGMPMGDCPCVCPETALQQYSANNRQLR